MWSDVFRLHDVDARARIEAQCALAARCVGSGADAGGEKTRSPGLFSVNVRVFPSMTRIA